MKNDSVRSLARKISLMPIFLAIFLMGTNFNLSTASSAEISGPQQRITMQERDFLIQIAQHIKNDTITANLQAIIEKLSVSPKLEEPQYQFMIQLSENISDVKVAAIIKQIAQNHKP